MSDFNVTVERVTICPHPNADRIELAQIGGYQSIVLKGQYKTGDLVAYIPEDSLVPDNILEEMNLVGRLSGPKKNRVKPIRLRKVLSQGLCYPAQEGWEEGQEVTKELGITKYQPVIPSQLQGNVWYAGSQRCLRYNINNWKRYPNILEEGETVQFTEKIHGTFCGFGFMPLHLHHEDEGDTVVFSKGLGGQGKALKRFSELNSDNLYIKTFYKFENQLRTLQNCQFTAIESPIYVLGEIFGRGMQDLTYGFDVKTDNIGYRIFDAFVGDPSSGRYLNDEELDRLTSLLELPRVPVLYRGPFSTDIMEQYTEGKETVSGKRLHMREGIVMKPVIERRHPTLGRVILKSVSEKYLLRKNGTDFT